MQAETGREKKADAHTLWTLFKTCFVISACTFGGGMVIISMLQKKFVEELKWIGQEEVMDLVAIAQSSPGAIAVNGAIVIGYKLAGFLGAATAILATILPPFAVISLVSVFYNAFRENLIISLMLEGMQAGVGAVIAVVVYEMGSGIIRGKSTSSNLIMAGAFLASCVFGVNVVLVVLVCGLIGVVRTLARGREERA